jgi:hypothetical protein
MKRVFYLIILAYSICCYGDAVYQPWRNCEDRQLDQSDIYDPWNEVEKIVIYTVPLSTGHFSTDSKLIINNQ